MNFKKSLLSLATVLALSNTAIADDTATYLPLSSETADSMWILFGVNGFSDGTASSTGTSSAAFTAGFTALEDTTTTDDIGTSGLSSGGNLVTLQALNDTGSFGTGLWIAADISTFTYDATEPVRTMYVKVNDNEPNVKIDYKASLEGSDFEITLNDVMYNSSFSQSSTWSNAATASTGNINSSGSSSSDRSAITEVLDFDFSDNPVEAKYFASADHLETTGVTASFYHFNPVIQQWEVYQKGATAAAQDFTSFNVGKAYWGRVDVADTLGALGQDVDGAVGLVLGEATQSSNLPDPDRYLDDTNTSILTTGWNMISFDSSQPNIRHSPTGLIISGLLNLDQLVITDASGLNSITLTAFTAAPDETMVDIANGEIESAKLRGLLPEDFNLKIFRGLADGTLVVLSDNQFTVANAVDGTNVTVTTMLGNNPYVSGAIAAVTDLGGAANGGPATSVYGEYMVAIEPMTGDTGVAVADDIGTANGGFSKMTITDATSGAQTVTITDVAGSTIAKVKENIEADITGAHIVTQIDADADGTAADDLVIIALDEPFSIADATYTRIFNYTAPAGAVSVTIDIGAGTAVPLTAVEATATLGAAEIDNGTSGVAGLYAGAAATNDELVVVYNVASTFDVKDVASGVLASDILTPATSTVDNVSKGAVKGVYSVDSLSRLALNQVSDTVTAINTDGVAASVLDNALDDWSVQVNAIAAVARGDAAPGLGAVAGSVNLITTYGELETMYDEMVQVINGICAVPANNLHCSASHDFTIPVGSTSATALTAGTAYTDGTITLTGVDVETVGLTIAIVDGDASGTEVQPTHAVATGDNKISVGAGDLVADLKSNAWKAPDFAIYGPLYTLREAGYDVRAILDATTEMDAVGGAIAWDSIDITRDENDWYANNEFGLFNISHNKGYWTYLETAAADTVSIDSATLTNPVYSYYFGNDASYTTTNNIVSAQLNVVISNLNDTTNGNAGSAYATVGGENVQLTRATGDNFTATLGTYALSSLTQDQSGPVSINIRAVNGKGEDSNTTALVSLDYAAPENVTLTAGATTIAVSADGNETVNFYAFEDYIPEVESVRDAAIIDTVTPAVGTIDACSNFAYGTDTTLRIVAADGTINSANLSDAAQIIYTNMLNGATVLTHTAGATPTAAGITYDASCAQSADNSASTTYNNGVSLETLTTGVTSRMSFVAIDNVNFTTDMNWVAHFEAVAASGTEVVQIKYASSYASDTFYLDYNGAIYSGTFPATQLAADATIITNPADLTAISGDNTTLVP